MDLVDVPLHSRGGNHPPPATSTSSTSTQPPPPTATTTTTASTRSGGRREEGQHGEEEFELKYGAEHVIRLFVPISICMAFVIATMRFVKYYSTPDPNMTLMYTPFRSDATDDASTRAISGLANSLIMICFIVVMTFGLILLYKFRCYLVIHGWLIVSSCMLLTIFSAMFIKEVMRAYNWVASMPLMLMILFNYAAMGLICIHWKGPLMMQQGYLISVSALMALTFIKILPDWTPWTLLALVSVWDLIAVLCPKGPLNMLVKMSQERNEPIFPALIYSSGILLPYTIMMGVSGEEREKEVEGEKEEEEEDDVGGEEAVNQPSTSSVGPSGPHPTSVLIPSGEPKSKRPQVRRIPPPQRDEIESGTAAEAAPAAAPRVNMRRHDSEQEVEERGIKLGLGDFIFYSVLVGKASISDDWNTIVACYVAILVGLCATLLLLAVFKKALPALPISISIGLIFYFSTTFLITPFTTSLVTHQLTY